MLRESTDMLLCAEDLGAVPDCLPRMLSDLGILSLKIERWARDYKSAGHPLVPPSSYPRLSVCTPSVHDSTPLRAWWEESGWDREAYYRQIGGEGPCPETLGIELCRKVLTRAMRAASVLTVVQIQDYLALTSELRVADPNAERVNVPGTVGSANWSYRLPRSIEELRSHSGLKAAVRAVVATRAGAGGGGAEGKPT
jgi:4-alpha-glucanotransferase